MDPAARRTYVGIGASAGGIEAMKQFLENLPADTGMSFIVVQHLAPDRPSMLPNILSRWTSMPVRQVLDGTVMQPNEVYVVPPNAVMTVQEATLKLRPPSTPVREATPIDIFFSSLADDQGDDAVGIILSGTGSDGALGLKAIRENGGLTMAQGSDGSAPQYAGMPRSAVAAGSVDLIVSVEEMPARLISRRRHEAAPANEQGALGAVGAVRLEICAILRRQVGHDFSHYKQQTFLRRVLRRMQGLDLDAASYVERLRADANEGTLLFRDLLIGVTGFFRDPDTFEKVEHDVLPRLFDGRLPMETIRLWVPGCATGEEAYTWAMLLRERMDALPDPPQVQIFATDIDEAAIGVARTGRYPRLLVKGVCDVRLRRFFLDQGDTFVVRKEIRDLCTFSAHSVIRDPPFSRLDLVSCRNLLIYLDSDLQRHVLPVFHYALSAGGTLLLGGSETASQYGELFEAVDQRNRIYRRRDVPSPPLNLSKATTLIEARARSSERIDVGSVPAKISAAATSYMLEHFAPAFVVVSADGDAVHFSAGTGRFLEAAAGAPSRNLIVMARIGLRTELRAALRACVETGGRIERPRVAVDPSGRDPHFIALSVERLTRRELEPLYIVVFADLPPNPALDAKAAQLSGQYAHDATVEQLERDLRDTREEVQSTIEEYETAVEEMKSTNEEMHSVNEELQSSIEELETSKEETQSVNEELHTVNAQLTGMVDDLDRANSDLRNLFDSTDVGTIFLDRDMRVRSFTLAVTAIFSLIASDEGRPLTDIVSHIDYDTLRRDAAEVLEGRAPFEARVAGKDRRVHYLMRMLPYRASDGGIDGVVVTFVDVSKIVAAEKQQRLLVDELNRRVKNMLTVVLSLATQTLRRADSPEEFSETFTGRLHAMNSAYGLLARESWTEIPLHELLHAAIGAYAMREPDNSIALQGPPVMLKPRGALALGMAVHELAANAVKYGALSVPEGRVEIRWHVEDGRLAWSWLERDGPPVVPPARRGFGTTVIERSLAHELSAQVSFRFLPDGLRLELTVPLDPELIGRPGEYEEIA